MISSDKQVHTTLKREKYYIKSKSFSYFVQLDIFIAQRVISVMDFNAIIDPPECAKNVDIPEIVALRANKDPNAILITAFVGGWDSNAIIPLEEAIGKLREMYRVRGIHILWEQLTNDIVRNQLKINCSQLFTKLISADIHLLPTHLNQGMLGKGGTDSWNMSNILTNYERLQYHLGIPNGVYTKCPVWSQNKGKLYNVLSKLNLCVPTLVVSLLVSSTQNYDKIVE